MYVSGPMNETATTAVVVNRKISSTLIDRISDARDDGASISLLPERFCSTFGERIFYWKDAILFDAQLLLYLFVVARPGVS
jgi:hypothetical protein